MMFFNASAIKDELWWSWDKTWRLYHLHDMYNMICCLLMAPIISTLLCIFYLTVHWNCKFYSIFFLLFHGTFRARCLLTIENLSFLSFLCFIYLKSWEHEHLYLLARSLCLVKKAWELFQVEQTIIYEFTDL